MRRPSIACCRAAHSLGSASLQHVWISDDLLSLAVNRFFRASCPHQKRHGSHVPGPLEARRRATKRRMTIQTAMYPPGGIPPLFNFAALFGVRERGEPSWRYEAPSLRTEPLDISFGKPLRPPDPSPPSMIPTAPSTHALSPGFFYSPEAKKVITKESQRIDTVATGHKKVAPDQPATEAESCFRNFKKQLEPAGTLSEEDRGKLLIDAYQNCRPKIADTGEFSILVRRYLSFTKNYRTRWADRHIVSCLASPYAHLPPIYSLGAREMFRSLEKMSAASSDCIHGIQHVYEKYAKEAARSANRSKSADQDKNLCLLIRGLWESSFVLTRKAAQSQADMIEAPIRELLRLLSQQLFDSHVRTHVESILKDPKRTASQIVSLVTTCTRKPDLIPLGIAVLEHVPRRLISAWTAFLSTSLIGWKEEAPDVIMTSQLQHFETWLSMLRILDSKATRPDLALQTLTQLFLGRRSLGIPPHALVMTVLHALAGHKSMAGSSSDRLTNLMRSYAPTLREQQVANLCLNDMLTRLIFELHEVSIPNHGVLELMVPLLDQEAGLQSVLDLLMRVQSSGSALSQTAFLENYIAQVVDLVHQRDRSHERNRQHVAFALRTCQKIQRLLTELGARVRTQGRALKALQARRQLQHIIHRAQDAHIVPLTYRNVTTNIAKSVQTELLHQFAHQYSLDRTRTYRQNWRSIYYLYRYMLEHKLEIGPAFTKAVLRVCIIQPLSENHFVSSRRLIWVCELVAQVEGVDVAKEIEHIFWIWRGNLILHAKSTLKAVGVRGRAHISTLKRLGMI